MLKTLAPAAVKMAKNAYFRYIGNGQFRVGSRDEGDFTIGCIRPNNGPAIELKLRRGSSDYSTLQQIFRDLDYEFAEYRQSARVMARYRQILDGGRLPLIVDAGANIGLAALYFHRVFPEAFIVCVEPDANNFAELQRHLNGIPNVLPLQAAIAAEDGFAEVIDPTVLGWAVQTRKVSGDATSPLRVESLSMASVIARARNAAAVEPFLAKIDIEGFEEDLFSANTGWIDDFALIIAELHDWMKPHSASSRPFLQAVSARNRDFLYRGENVFSFRND